MAESNAAGSVLSTAGSLRCCSKPARARDERVLALLQMLKRIDAIADASTSIRRRAEPRNPIAGVSSGDIELGERVS